MAQRQRKVVNKISKREQARLELRRNKTNISMIIMRVVVIMVLIAMLMGLAIYIIG